MAKDPAFTMYYKDWLVSTAGWDADQRGWYINLLCHQADKPEGLPDDIEALAELAGVKHSQFKRFSECFKRTLEAMFQANEKGLLENKTLSNTLNSRRGYKENQAERGAIGYWVKIARRDHGINEAMAKQLYSSLKEQKLLSIPKENRIDCFKRTLEAIYGSVNANGNANGNTVENKGGTGEKGEDRPLLPEMKPEQYPVHNLMTTWRTQFPKYPADQVNDFPALWQISEFLRRQKGLPADYSAAGVQTAIGSAWGEIVAHIAENAHFCRYSLQQVSKHIQAIIQSATVQKPAEKGEIQFLYEMFLEKGKVPLRQISEVHYARLNEKGLVPPVTDRMMGDLRPQRVSTLEGSNDGAKLRLLAAYVAEKPTPEQLQLIENDRPVLQLHARRLLVLEFFSQQRAAGAANVFQVRKTA